MTTREVQSFGRFKKSVQNNDEAFMETLWAAEGAEEERQKTQAKTDKTSSSSSLSSSQVLPSPVSSSSSSTARNKEENAIKMAPDSTTPPGNHQKPRFVMETAHKKKTTRPSPSQPQYIPSIIRSTATATTTTTNTMPKCEHHHDHTSQVAQLKKEIQELKDQINILKKHTSSSIVPNQVDEDETNHNNLVRIVNEQKAELESLRGRNTILEDKNVNNQRVLEDLRKKVKHEKTKFEEFKANLGIQEKEKLAKARDYSQDQNLRLVGEKSECIAGRDKIKADLENAKLEMTRLTNSKELLAKAGDEKASRIATLEAETLKLHKEKAKLEESCTTQEAAIAELLEENEKLKEKIVKLANEVANLHQQLILVVPFASPATAVPVAPENENDNNQSGQYFDMMVDDDDHDDGGGGHSHDNYYKHSSRPNNFLDISSNTTGTNEVKLLPDIKPFPTPPPPFLEEDHCDEEDDYRPNLPQDCKSNHHLQQQEPIQVLASEPQHPSPRGDLQEKVSALEDQIRIIRQLLQSQQNNNNSNNTADDKSIVAAQPCQAEAKILLPSCSKQTNSERKRKRKIFKQEEDIGTGTSDHHSSRKSSRSSSSTGSCISSKNSSSRSRSSSATSSDDDYKNEKKEQGKKKINKSKKSGNKKSGIIIQKKHKKRDRQKRRKLQEEEVKRIAKQHLEFLQKTVAGGVRGVTNNDIRCRRCKVCKKKLSSKQYLILHIQSQHLSDERLPDESLKCQLCNHFYSNTSNLNAHVKQFHPNVNIVKVEDDN